MLGKDNEHEGLSCRQLDRSGAQNERDILNRHSETFPRRRPSRPSGLKRRALTSAGIDQPTDSRGFSTAEVSCCVGSSGVSHRLVAVLQPTESIPRIIGVQLNRESDAARKADGAGANLCQLAQHAPTLKQAGVTQAVLVDFEKRQEAIVPTWLKLRLDVDRDADRRRPRFRHVQIPKPASSASAPIIRTRSCPLLRIASVIAGTRSSRTNCRMSAIVDPSGAWRLTVM